MARITTVLLLLIIFPLFNSGCGKPPPAEEPDRPETAAGKKSKTTDIYSSRRDEMVSYQLEFRGIVDRKVLDTMRRVPRHIFVPDEYKEASYADTPLPIGYGQTISQPYIVALMTELIDVDRSSKVLEVGTGSGYQAAVLSGIAGQVYTVELVRGLHERSARDLKTAGYSGVKTRQADGYYGWPEHSPYDAIIVTCASEFIPPPLISQLKKGGRMCIPVGPPFKVQHLLLVRKSHTGKVSVEIITEVRFVPLVRSGT